MTPADIELAARQRYNAVGETFWTAAEYLGLIYAACLELAQETQCIQRTYETTTVIGQQEYAFPTTTAAIKRVTYNGNKLRMINLREDDALTFNNSTTTATGNAQYYATWNYTMILRPIPDSAVTLKIYSINEPQVLTSTSTLEIPSLFHMRIVDYLLSEMYAKDKDVNTAAYYRKLWEKAKIDVKKWVRLRNRTDSFTSVQDEEALPESFLGAI